MKKRLLAIPLVVGIAGAAYAGTSHFAGNQTKEQYERALQTANDQQRYFTLSNEEYTSGLVKSTAVTKVTIPELAEDEIVFSLLHEIDHGAVHTSDEGVKVASVSVRTTLLDPQALPEEVQAGLTDDILFEILSDIGYSGEAHSRVRISGLNVTEDSTTMDWSGLNADAVTAGEAIIAEGSFGSLQVNDQSEGIVMSVDSSDFTADVLNEGNSLYTGNVVINFNDLTLQTPELAARISINKVAISSDSEVDGDAMNSSVAFNVDGIDAPAPVPLDSATFEMQYNGFSVDGWLQYNQLASSLSRPADDESLDEIVSAIRMMFMPGTEVKALLNLTNSDGEVDTDIRVALKDADAEGMSADALDTIVTARDLLNVLEIEANLDADRAAIMETPIPMMLGMVGDFITVDEESITSAARLEGTDFNINGVIMPLDTISRGRLDVPLIDFTLDR